MSDIKRIADALEKIASALNRDRSEPDPADPDGAWHVDFGEHMVSVCSFQTRLGADNYAQRSNGQAVWLTGDERRQRKMIQPD